MPDFSPLRKGLFPVPAAGRLASLQHRLDHRAEIPVQLLRGLPHPAPDPPEHHLHKAAGDVVDQEVLRDVQIGPPVLAYELLLDQLIQAVLEIPQEDLAALAGEQAEDVVLVLPQMLQQVAVLKLK